MRRYIPFVILGSVLVLLVAAGWTAGLNYADDSVPIGQQPIDAGYRTARVCVDDASTQGLYLDGGELVGPVMDNTAFGLAGTIQAAELVDMDMDDDYRYFFGYTLASGGVQLSVTDAGASGLGLDDTHVYPVRLEVVDDTVFLDDPLTAKDEAMNGLTAMLDVGVWVDASTLSPGDDGACR